MLTKSLVFTGIIENLVVSRHLLMSARVREQLEEAR